MRMIWVLVDILMVIFVVNVFIIGMFMRDKGVKKKKFKYELIEL